MPTLAIMGPLPSQSGSIQSLLSFPGAYSSLSTRKQPAPSLLCVEPRLPLARHRRNPTSAPTSTTANSRGTRPTSRPTAASCRRSSRGYKLHRLSWSARPLPLAPFLRLSQCSLERPRREARWVPHVWRQDSRVLRRAAPAPSHGTHIYTSGAVFVGTGTCTGRLRSWCGGQRRRRRIGLDAHEAE